MSSTPLERAEQAVTVDRAAILREGADAVFALDYDDQVEDPENIDSIREAWDLGTIHATELLRRMADEAQQPAPWLSDSARIGRTLIWTWADIGKGVYGQGYRAAQTEARTLLTGQRDSDEAQQPEPTPCSQPSPCEDGELCDVHEEEQAHADGEHAFCGVRCEVQFPSEPMRNFILAKGYPGAAGALNELLRRAAERRPAPADACPVHSPDGFLCGCGHDRDADCHPNPNGVTR
ncbi:MAG: hypothetical protein JWO98_1439 [Frankiales bacterium]|nr:hypothetical protein [Frankiales bacterium]